MVFFVQDKTVRKLLSVYTARNNGYETEKKQFRNERYFSTYFCILCLLDNYSSRRISDRNASPKFVLLADQSWSPLHHFHSCQFPAQGCRRRSSPLLEWESANCKKPLNTYQDRDYVTDWDLARSLFLPQNDFSLRIGNDEKQQGN